MLFSMTGFGNTQTIYENYTLIAEIKSINSKGLDLGVRIPRQLPAEKEIWVRNWIKEQLERGKIFVFLDIIPHEDVTTNTEIRHEVVKTYIKEAQKIAQETNTDTQGLLAWALSMPDATKSKTTTTDDNQDKNLALLEEENQKKLENLWEACQKILEISLEKCKSFRLSEGLELKKMFENSIKIIQDFLLKIEEQDPQRRTQIRQRLEERLAEITHHEYYDKNRFEQEMIYYLEKMDISEEKMRLTQHLHYFLKSLEENDINGKKLNFISQEIGREINTIGSKANDATMQQYVVVMKDELEKIKEQCANAL